MDKILMTPSSVNIVSMSCSVATVLKWVQSYDVIVNSSRFSDEDASAFIESLMLKIPIPCIYLEKKDKECVFFEDGVRIKKNRECDVVDGNRRLNAIRDFILNRKRFSNFQFYPEFNGMMFHDLPESIQNKVKEKKLTIHVIQNTCEDTSHELRTRIQTSYEKDSDT